MAKSKDFKFIKGAYCAGSPADICYYTDVDYWSVQDFLWEFDYLINYVNPSKIRIHINSVGGSVIEGMSVFAKIMDCKIPTECINDALAASMGSIIWAAGDELYMKDYALLMIHNPFCDADGEKQYNQATEAFTQQLKTIYVKRFGLSEEEVENIMNGKEGDDGTFLTAAQAVEKGFVQADHVIETPKAIKDQIQAALKDTKDVGQIKAIYGLVSPTLPSTTINEQKTISKLNTMDESKITVFAALFGLTGDKATADNVTAKINELKAKADKAESTQKALDETKAELTKANAELTGAKTSIKNLTEDLTKTKEALKVYQDAEAKAQEKKVNDLIDKAIAECKINKDEREDYLKMARNDFEMAERVLAKIPARDNLGGIISHANQQEAIEGTKTEEQKIQAKVEEVVGQSFKFRTLD
jgi:ATP-dependent protease ClpP protease subunit|uniref:Putative ATP dependent Clp protease n=1 Tax=Siphoviridae sp. ctOCb13 TaxID=2825477 RepID=A0A8S5Q0V3_9CAUD|nr:MAG TPA: putative ATP dependent Clp protease [Siphoviridae sp. ctOCb13]